MANPNAVVTLVTRFDPPLAAELGDGRRVRVAPGAVARSQAIVLRRTDARAPVATARPMRRVTYRLAGPGVGAARGLVPLAGADRLALLDGRLSIVHVTVDAPLGVEAFFKPAGARP